MSAIVELTAEQQALFDQWLATRPLPIQAIASKYPPNRLYRLPPPSAHRVTIASYDEDDSVTGGVTVTVNVSGDFNLVAFERNVFGVDPATLEECDLAGPDEPLGCSSIG